MNAVETFPCPKSVRRHCDAASTELSRCRSPGLLSRAFRWSSEKTDFLPLATRRPSAAHILGLAKAWLWQGRDQGGWVERKGMSPRGHQSSCCGGLRT